MTLSRAIVFLLSAILFWNGELAADLASSHRLLQTKSFTVGSRLAESNTQETRVSGTNLQAKAIAIHATQTDLLLEGAKLQADTIALIAEGDIQLKAAANTAAIHSQSKSTSFHTESAYCQPDGC